MRKSNWLKGINQLFKFYQKKKVWDGCGLKLYVAKIKWTFITRTCDTPLLCEHFVVDFFLFPRCFQREIVDSVHFIAVLD